MLFPNKLIMSRNVMNSREFHTNGTKMSIYFFLKSFQFEFTMNVFTSLSPMSSLDLFLSACWPGRKGESSNAEESQLGLMSTQTPVQKHIIMHTNIRTQTGHPSVWTIHRLVMRCPI